MKLAPAEPVLIPAAVERAVCIYAMTIDNEAFARPTIDVP